MEINAYSNNIHYHQHNSLKTNENKDFQDFGVMLNAKQQESQNEEVQKERTPYLVNLDEHRMLGAAAWISAVREAMNIQGVNDPSKVNPAIVNEVRMRRAEETDPKKLREMLEEYLGILQEPYAIQRGSYMGEAESEAHFQARKNQAIDYAKELLQEFKA